MGVKKVGEKYRCNICGNEVTVTKVGGGTLVCCGQEMELISSQPVPELANRSSASHFGNKKMSKGGKK